VHQHGVPLPDETIVDRPHPTVNASLGSRNGWLRAGVSLVCAASAGVHLALVAEHAAEGPLVGIAFAASAVALGVGAVAARRPLGRVGAVAGLLIGVAACYLLSRTTGIPGLVPEPEHLEAVGMLTTAAEVLAALACLPLNREEHR
jgi:hypothetical protein